MTVSAFHARAPKNLVQELLMLSSILLLSSCSSIRTTSSPDFRIHPGDTYAWIDSSPSGVTGDEGVPWTDFRQAIDEAFSLRGIRQVAPGEETFLVRARLAVEVGIAFYDPEYDLNAKEKYEEGSLYIELLSGSTRDRLWAGECRHRLRYVARTRSGDSSERWVPTGETRSWRVEDVVARILQRLPEEEPGRDSGRTTVGAGAPREARR